MGWEWRGEESRSLDVDLSSLRCLLDDVAGRIMAPEGDHTLIPRTCEYVTLYGKVELRLQMEINLLFSSL